MTCFDDEIEEPERWASILEGFTETAPDGAVFEYHNWRHGQPTKVIFVYVTESRGVRLEVSRMLFEEPGDALRLLGRNAGLQAERVSRGL